MPETLALFIPILGTVGTFGSLIIWIYVYYNSRHKERMALIERDKDASIFKIPHREQHNSLKIGVVTIMIGLGILIAHMLGTAGLDEVVAYFSMILLFGGSGLVFYYAYMQRRKDKDRQQDMV